jgi:hypothetical protein
MHPHPNRVDLCAPKETARQPPLSLLLFHANKRLVQRQMMEINQSQPVNGENGRKPYAVSLAVEVQKREHVLVKTPIMLEVNA